MANYSVIIFITLIFSAFFSGMEIAFLSANKLRIELDRKQGGSASKIISIFINNPSKYLTTMLVGNNVALVIYGTIMARILAPVLESFISNEIVILCLQTIVSTLIILFTGEFLPKMIFRNIANASLNLLSVPVLFFYIIFYPITYSINLLSQAILKRIRKEHSISSREKDAFDKVDLIYFINQSNIIEENAETQTDEIKLFQNALDFSSVKVRDCMVPRTEIKAFEEGSSQNELINAFIESGYSKILIYRENIDNIIGYITSKSLFEPVNNKSLPIIDISFVPETMSANKLLKKLIQDKKSLAVVVDEFGGVSGMLTIEDIIEEIFGEIEDEHDYSEFIEKVISEKEFIFSGRLEIDHINDTYNLNIPESEEYETLAGFVIFYHESIPKVNERITIDKFEIKTLKTSSTKVELIHLKIND